MTNRDAAPYLFTRLLGYRGAVPHPRPDTALSDRLKAARENR